MLVICRGNEHQQGVEKGQSEAFEDVQLGPLLGQGGFGKVYRGLWSGAAVAVKVGQPCCACCACCAYLLMLPIIICFVSSCQVNPKSPGASSVVVCQCPE